jgi:hypothetical protein
MANVLIDREDAYYGSSCPYYSRLIYTPDPTEDWATIINTTTAGGAGGTTLLAGITADNLTDKWYSLSVGDFSYDLRDMLVQPISHAMLYFSSVKVSTYLTSGFFSTDSRNGLGLVPQRRSVRGVNRALANMGEIIHGMENQTELATRKALSVLPTTYAPLSYTFDANGLAYLNGLLGETDHPGYAFLTVGWGGIIDSETPTWTGSGWQQFQLNTGSYASLLLYYDDTISPRVGVSYGPGGSQRVQAVNLSVSNAWRTVVEIKVSIGGVWEDVL